MKAYQLDNLNVYTHNMYTWLNLDTKAYSILPSSVEIWSDAYSWYPTFASYALNLGISSGKSKEELLGALAILSANVHVSVNISEFKLLLKELESNKHLMNKQSTANKNKARLAILGDAEQVSGKKIKNFYYNLLEGNSSLYFTNDTHMIRSCQNQCQSNLIPGLMSGTIKGNDKEVIQQAATQVASEVSLPVPVLQAYIWLISRAIKTKKYESGLVHLN